MSMVRATPQEIAEELADENRRILRRVGDLARRVGRSEIIIEGLIEGPETESEMWKTKAREWLEEIRREGV
jgi:hypothetical protein